jgi:hypothetical protein
MSHTCHAQGSSVEAPPKLFMCKRMVHAAEGGARRRVKALPTRPGERQAAVPAIPDRRGRGDRLARKLPPRLPCAACDPDDLHRSE